MKTCKFLSMEMMHVQSTYPEIPTTKCTAALSGETFQQANYQQQGLFR